MSDPLARTPLHALHLELGARMVPFAGFELPLQYAEGLRAEHLWTRGHAGLFDVSHMGQLRVRGPRLFAALERALPVDFDGWPQGVQRYSLLLNERGGIEDDLMVTRLADEVAIVVNAARREHDLALLKSHCPELEFSLLDHALIALQGPRAAEVLPEFSDLNFMESRLGTARSGYTGEDGFEISVPSARALVLAKKLLESPLVKAIGLGARDTLRLEAGLPLYGQDLDPETTPREAGLAWAIARSRRVGGGKAGGFPGAQHAERGRRRRVGLVGVEPVPVRQGADLVDAKGAPAGRVTSGTVSPTLGRPIMMAYVDATIRDDADLRAVVRGRAHPVRITAMPFVAKRYRRKG